MSLLSNSTKEKNLNNFNLLLNSSKKGISKELEKLLNVNNYSQEEIDISFRECIKNYIEQNEDYKNSIKNFLKFTSDINYQNINYNNTTILMYAIDNNKNTPCDLIISCCGNEIDQNVCDDNGDNIFFHIIKSKLDDNSQKEFFESLLNKKTNLDYKSQKEKKLINLIEELKKNFILDVIKNFKNKNKFDLEKLNKLYNKKDYQNLEEEIQYFNNIEKEFYLKEKYKNYSFEFNLIFLKKKNYQKKLKNLMNENKYNNKNFLTNILEEHNKLLEFDNQIINILNSINLFNNYYQISDALFINKIIMYYQFDFFEIINKINNNENLFNIKNSFFTYFYFKLILIDMLINREKYLKAFEEFNLLKKYNNEKINLNLNYYNNNDNIENNKYIIPFDIFFNFTNNDNIQLLINLYEIFFHIYEKKQNSNNKSIIDLINKIGENTINNISNLQIKNFYYFLKIKILFLTQKSFSIKINYNLEKLLNNEIKNEISEIYYYNTMGIINIKNKKYILANFYLSKCLNLIKLKTKYFLIKRNLFYPKILFNISLCNFYQKKYNNCINILYKLINYSNNKNKFFVKNKFIYYRLALSMLELNLEKKKLNNIYKCYKNNKFYLYYNSPKESNSNFLPNEIIINFKKVLLLIKNNKNDKIYLSTYLNIIFCNIINQNYVEAIYFLNNIKFNKNNVFIKNLKNFYSLQCYIYLNKLDLAQKISENIVLDSNLDLQENYFYQKINLYDKIETNFRIAFYINLIKMNIKLNKKDEIEKILIYLLDQINLNITINQNNENINTNEEIPIYLINIFVYYYLFKNKVDLAINLLKYKNIKYIFLTNKKNNYKNIDKNNENNEEM